VKNLTYRVAKYPVSSRLSRREVDQTMAKAFRVWEEATDLKFTKQTSGKVHIEIRFEKRSHGDDDPFDGEGGTLAHAFFPVFGGDAHFDDEEDWTVNTHRGTSLLMTASHELGHSLGLSHSNVRSSLMAPFYRGYDANLKLEADDIKGIQALYGKKTGPSSTNVVVRTRSNIPTATTRRPTTTSRTTRRPFFPSKETEATGGDNEELCNQGHLDTLVTMKDSVTYAFLGSLYWRLTETSVEPGYPRSISADWDGLPGDLDASFTWTNGKTYFFKGSKYWRFSGVGEMDNGYPKELDKGFSGIPNDVDAAFVWPVNDKIYFFKGSIYWKFDPDKSPPVAPSYPRPISNWDGIPSNLDSALQYSNGKSYFFKDGRYYRFDDKKFTLDVSANPPFPRETGFWWFGCPANSVRLTMAEDVGWADVAILD
jgi:matrix metalloproteinase-14 (membrane-inserted)